jgi:iron complex outermembrane receptor protein
MNRMLVSTFVLLASTVSGLAAAQSDQSSSGALEEVTVTAQRREESLQSVPIAVSAFTANQLEERLVTSTIDLVKMVPNLFGHNNTGTSTANTYFLRGLGSTEQIAMLDPAVSTYVDDVIIPRQNANNYALFDVERLEVLRGPQGTTFGRNSTGGAINVITRKPGKEFGGSVSVGGGSFSKKLFRGTVDAPFSDTVLSKFSAFYVKDDGYLTNVGNGEKLNGSKNTGGRAALRVLFANEVTWDIAAEYLEADGVFVRAYLDDRDSVFTPFTTGGGTSDIVSDMINKRGLRNETSATSVTSNVQWNWGGATINAITGYRTVDQIFVLDFGDPNPAVAGVRTRATATLPQYFTFAINNDGKYDMFSQEFKATGSFNDDRVKYVAGIYFFSEDNITKAGQATGSGATGVPLALTCSTGFFGEGPIPCGAARGYSSFRDMRNKTDSIAAYAQFDWQVGDRTTLILGGRFTDDTKKLNLVATPQGAMTTADLVAAGVATKLKSSEFTPKAGINFQVNDDVMLYASGTRGFKSGGWNSRTAYRPQEFQPMQPEKTTSYELGMKSEWLNRRLRLNGNFYYATTKGLQLAYSTPGPIVGTTLSTQDNAGDIKTKGFELEVVARFNEYVDLYASLGLQDGEYTSVNARARSSCTNGGAIVNGACANPTPPLTTTGYTNAIDLTDGLSRFPEKTGNLGLNFQIPAEGLGGKFSASVELQYTGPFWTTASNAVPNLQLIPGGPFVSGATVLSTRADSFTLVNAGLVYRSSNDAWKVTVDCKNCSDKTYKISVFNGLFFGDPRRYDVSLAYKF